MAEMTLLSQLSLWEGDTTTNTSDDGDVKTNVCGQTLELLNLKLYRRKFYKR